ncbi:MAG: type VI secretion system-associated protein TagF [Ignavibacterium sp.]|jgi:type VI secretion system ImpM family protein|nr:type VI secretion system-associated protein TagF [Ignavibacterium sp.]
MLNDNSTNTKNVTTGFFGKLTGFADFIKYNASGNEILTVDSWLQEGLALAKLKLKNEWKNYYDKISNINFIYPFTDTDNITIGIMVPSCDKSGRSYPFLVFRNIEKKANEPNYLIPSFYNRLFVSFEEVIEENKTIQDTADLKAVMDNLNQFGSKNPNIFNDYKNFVSRTDLNSLFGFDDNEVIQLNNYLENNIKIFLHLICIKYKSTGVQSDSNLIISFYIQLIQILFKNPNTSPAVFWIKYDDNSGVIFFTFSKPTPKDFIDLLLNSNNSEITVNTTDQNSISNGKNLIQDGLMIDYNLNLTEFLNYIKTHLN